MTGASVGSERVRRRRRDVIGSRPMVPRSGGGRRVTLPDARAEVALDEGIEVAVQDGGRVAGLHAGAEVLDHRVRLEDVGPDLVPPAGLHVFPAEARHLGLALLNLALD